MSDYYKILGLNKNSSNEDIKKQYKKLAIKWHPDKNINNKEKAEAEFKKISEAYQILSDKDKKKQYDVGGSIRTNFNSTFMNPNDIFTSVFGNSFFSNNSTFNKEPFFFGGSNFQVFTNINSMSSFSSTSRSESYVNGQKIVKEKKNINGIITETTMVDNILVSKKENGIEKIENN
jgi:DnaJ-class molecular chaperone